MIKNSIFLFITIINFCSSLNSYAQINYFVNVGIGQNFMSEDSPTWDDSKEYIYHNWQISINYQFNQWISASSGIGVTQNAYYGPTLFHLHANGIGTPLESSWVQEGNKQDFFRVLLFRIPIQVLINPFGDRFGLFAGFGLHNDISSGYEDYNRNPEQPIELLQAKRNYPTHAYGFNGQLGYQIKRKPFRIDFGIQGAIDAKPWLNDKISKVNFRFWQADYFVRFWIN